MGAPLLRKEASKNAIFLSLLLVCYFPCRTLAKVDPAIPTWPSQFHAVLFQNRSDSLALVDLYYDYTSGRNLNLIRPQLGSELYDVEYTNGTSFYFRPAERTCRPVSFPVGILTPDWLRGAQYLGVQTVDGKSCFVWTKADFVTYWEDEKTRFPVRWRFHTSGAQFEIMKFEKGATLPDPQWQAPDYCFLGRVDAEGQAKNEAQGGQPMGAEGDSPVAVQDPFFEVPGIEQGVYGGILPECTQELLPYRLIGFRCRGQAAVGFVA